MQKSPVLNLALAEAIQIGLFYTFFEDLLISNESMLQELRTSFDFDNMALEYDQRDLLDLDIHKDSREYLNYILYDDEKRLLTSYYDKVRNKSYRYHEEYYSEADLQGYDIDSLYDDLVYLVESDIAYGENDISKESFEDYFCLNEKIGLGKYPFKGKIYLTPFIFLLLKPFSPWYISTNIISDMKLALTDDEPITFEELSLKMEKSNSGWYLEPKFLYSLAINNFQFLITENEEDINVDLSDEIIPKFYDLKNFIEPKDYMSCSSERFLLKNKNNLEPVIKKLEKKIKFGKYSNYDDELNYRELAFKLIWDYENQSILDNVNLQDVETVKEQVIKLIRKYKKILKYDQIIRELNLDTLPFEPKTLGPGELLAWGRTKHFYKKNTAVYVTSELVGSHGNMRGKIHPKNIITPLSEKNYTFDDLALKDALDSDVAYQEYGLLDVKEIAENIANTLPDRPIEIFYIEKIKEKINDYLDERYDFVDLYKDRFRIKRDKIIGINRGNEEPLYRWKTRVARHITGLPDVTNDSLRTLDEPIQSRINSLLRRKA